MLQPPGNLCLIFAEKMMEGNSYSEASLREAIIQKFGKQQHFYPHRISEEERKIHAGRKWVYSRHK